MRQCPDVALSSPCVQAVRESSLPHSEPDVLIMRLDPGVPLPSYAHPGDAGADLATAEDVELGPGERALVPTGIAIALPDGNAAGTVDAGYRGEIKVTLLNTDRDRAVSFRRGDRIAQLVIQRVERVVFHEVPALPESGRGDGGFGSTGLAGVGRFIPPGGGRGGRGGKVSPQDRGGHRGGS